MKKDTFRVALPKGRMSEESLAYLYKHELVTMKTFPNSRKLMFSDPETNYEFLLVRSKDVGTYVEQGSCDAGIIGYDLLAEHDFDVLIPGDLPFGHCKLCVAYPENDEGWKKKRNIKVASKYPKLTSKFFFEKGYHARIIELYGSIEIAPLTGLSDVIVDLVSTGQTLKENKLLQGETILESHARLIVNRTSHAFKNQQINQLLDILNL
ncbi:MAG: ATP phosphoribosyltransferase [Leptospirales bacterium]